MVINIYNSCDEVVHLTPKTILVNIIGADVSVQEFGKKVRKLIPRGRQLLTSSAVQVNSGGEIIALNSPFHELQLKSGNTAQLADSERYANSENTIENQSVEVTSELIEREVKRRFPKVGDLSSHPVNEEMAKLIVRKDEVCWTEPKEAGVRTQYAVEKVADRRKIAEQIEAMLCDARLYSESLIRRETIPKSSSPVKEA